MSSLPPVRGASSSNNDGAQRGGASRSSSTSSNSDGDRNHADDEATPQRSSATKANTARGSGGGAAGPAPPQQRKPAQTARSYRGGAQQQQQQAQPSLQQAAQLRELLHLPGIADKPNSVIARYHTASTSPAANGGGGASAASPSGSPNTRATGSAGSPSQQQQQQQAEGPMPFQVPETADGIAHLPAEAWIPRENPAEERRRLKLLELYWNNSNPHLSGLFSTYDPIDRLLSRFAAGDAAAAASAGGGGAAPVPGAVFVLPQGGAEGRLIATLRHSVLLNQLPRSTLQRRIDFAIDKRAERKRLVELRKAAKRALQQDTSDEDGEGGGSAARGKSAEDSKEAELQRRQREKGQRAHEQDERREALRKRFFDGDVFDEHDVNWRRANNFGALHGDMDVGLGARRARAQQTKNHVAAQAQAMREAAEARRLAAMKRRQDDDKERARRLAEEKAAGRGARGESEADRERRDFAAQKKRERLAAMEAERERMRQQKEEEDARKADKAARARAAAKKKADELERERQARLREKQAESEQRRREEEAEAEAALQRKKSIAHKEPEYVHDGPPADRIPIASRKVIPCFEDGKMLFRVVETDPAIKGKRWHFYNDTAKTTFHVKIFFVPPCSVRPIGDAELLEQDADNDSGEVVISVKVPPLQTVSFSEGQVKQFSAEIDAEDEASSPEGSQGDRNNGSLSGQGSGSDYVLDGDQEGTQRPLAGAPNYKHGAPTGIDAPYEVYECIEGEGILFRIVKRDYPEPGMCQWWYYNDDDTWPMKIQVKFGPKSDIVALGGAAMRKIEPHGVWEVTAECGCIATIPFIRGRVNGFSQAFDIVDQPLLNSPSPMRRLDRKKSMSGAERAKYIKELQDRAADLVRQFADFARAQGFDVLDPNTRSMTDSFRNSNKNGNDDDDGADGALVTMAEMLEAGKEQDVLVAALKAKHFFIDLRFPPLMQSVSNDQDQLEDLAELCWCKAEDYAQLQQLAPEPPPAAGKAGKAGSAASSPTAAAAAAKQQQQQPVKAAPIVGGTVSASDIQAGAISDWWILSGIAVLALTPFRVTQLFKNHPMGPAVEKREVAQGIYRVKMLVGGWWTDVVVDDWMPVEIDARGHPSLFFAHSAKGPHELWVSLIEKAFAKTSGDRCFTELGNGDSLHIMEDLTGFPSVRLDPRLHPDAAANNDDDAELDSDNGGKSDDLSQNSSFTAEERDLFKDFQAYLERGWLVVLNTAQPPDDEDEHAALTELLTGSGLEVDCTYKVMDAKEFTHLGKTHRLVRICNPWGKGTEWKGKWSWGNSEWKRIPTAWKLCHPDPPELPAFPGIAVGGGDGGGGDGMSFAVPTIGISVDVPDISVGGAAPAAAAAAPSKKDAAKKGGSKGAAAAASAADSGNKKGGGGVGKSPDDSTFWMEWRDMKRYFQGAGVCYLQTDWHDYRIPGRFENGHPTIGLEVRCTERTRAYILLMQQSGAGFDAENPAARYAGALLSIASRRPEEGDFEIKRNSDLYFDKPSKDLTFVMGRSLGMEYTFEPSDEDVHLVVPRCFSKTATKDYVLAVILDQPVGEGVISFRFRHFKPELGIFDGFPTFSYIRSQHVDDNYFAATNGHLFQYKPPNGRAQVNRGEELEGAPSDLVAGRTASRLGAQSSLGGAFSPSQSGAGGLGGSGGGGAGAAGAALFQSPSSGSKNGGGGDQAGGMFRPVSSMSFEILTDVLVHIRNASELPFEVNALAVFDFRGVELFRTSKLLAPASRTPSWAQADKEAGAPLGYVWNEDHRNLTFKLMYIDPATGEAETRCEGKSTWDDAQVAAKLPTDPGTNRRPVVALRLRVPAAMRQSMTNALAGAGGGGGGSSKDIVGSLSVSFTAVSRTTDLNSTDCFTLVIDGASSFKRRKKQEGDESGSSSSSTATTHVVVHSGKTQKTDAIFVSGDSMGARPGEVMFMGAVAECVLHNNGHGFLLQITDAEDDAVVYAETLLTLATLMDLSGRPDKQRVVLDAAPGAELEKATADGAKPWITCKVQAFHSDN